jgi:hypothetical protein
LTFHSFRIRLPSLGRNNKNTTRVRAPGSLLRIPKGIIVLGKEDALRAYAAMMNTLDASNFAPLLADDFHYASQWVFAEIESKQEYLPYITAKLQAVKDTDAKVWAEMGEIEESSAAFSDGFGDPCVLMAQGEKDHVAAVVLAEVKDGKIKRLDMCMPDLYLTTRSGKYPA